MSQTKTARRFVPVDHVKVKAEQQIIVCLHCGGSIPIGTGMELGEAINSWDRFLRKHRSCRKPQQP